MATTGEEVGIAFVRLVPTMRGFGPEAERALTGGIAQPAAAAGDSAGESFGGRFKLALAGVGIAAGAVLVKGIGEALDQEKIVDKLQVQLGATPKVAERAGKIAGGLFAHAVTDDFQGAADAVKAVMSNGLAPPDATNKQIGSIATKVSDLATTFDQDLGGVTNAVSQMLRTGLAPNAEAATDILTKGFQSSANKADDLLDTFNEYGTQFRKAGIDGAMAVGLMNQAILGGARDSDLAADAIKEFSIRAVDGSATTAQGFKMLGLNAKSMGEQFGRGGKSATAALDTTLDRLRGIKDPVLQAQAATALFGTQAEDLGKALFKMDPSTAVASIGKVTGAADTMGKTLRDNTSTKIEVFKRRLQQGFVQILGTQVIPRVETFSHWMVKAGGGIQQATGFVQRNATAFKIAGGIIGTVLLPTLIVLGVTAVTTSATVVAGWVAQGVAATVAGARTIAANTVMVAGWIASAATAVWSAGVIVAGWALMGVQALFRAAQMAAAWVIAMGPVGWITAGIIALTALIILKWDTIKAYTVAVWDWIWGKIKAITGAIVDVFMHWTLYGIVIGHWRQILNTGMTVWNAISNFVKAIPGRLVGFFLHWTLPGLVISHFTQLKNGAVAKGAQLVTWVKGLPGQISRGVGSLGTLLYGKGEDVVRGLWNGIRDMGGWLRSKLTGWAKSAIPGPIAHALGIGSPSKLMADEIGHWIPAGIAVGAEDNLDIVSTATRIAAAAALPPAAAQTGRSMTAAPTFVIDAGGLDRALLEWLQNAIRTKGGGNVQKALGWGAG